MFVQPSNKADAISYVNKLIMLLNNSTRLKRLLDEKIKRVLLLFKKLLKAVQTMLSCQKRGIWLTFIKICRFCAMRCSCRHLMKL